ncbi:hypothetical protein [Flectobacillus rivi]|uniref:Uncharacterized protein n=1 Tax=Flectobacillus rivi TaxID=2984209 RepID=A0ABT6Z8L8_9BACT|nr:hypothetical protein [Flectobacillus rivi]MDI9877439.1 hypothetical protein [Flectobacillus rivi]
MLRLTYDLTEALSVPFVCGVLHPFCVADACVVGLDAPVKYY